MLTGTARHNTSSASGIEWRENVANDRHVYMSSQHIAAKNTYTSIGHQTWRRVVSGSRAKTEQQGNGKMGYFLPPQDSSATLVAVWNPTLVEIREEANAV
jgi:hypothetical protein